MQRVLSTIDEHYKIIESLGYNISLTSVQLLIEGEAYILKDNKCVGIISIEEKNLYYMYKDNIKVCNKDLSTINFSTRKKKNIRTLIHTIINDNNLIIDNYNMLVRDDRPFVTITDKKHFEITKILEDDYIKPEALKEDIDEDTIIDDLKHSKKYKLILENR